MSIERADLTPVGRIPETDRPPVALGGRELAFAAVWITAGGDPPPVASTLPSGLNATLASPSRRSERTQRLAAGNKVPYSDMAIRPGGREACAPMIVGERRSSLPSHREILARCRPVAVFQIAIV